MTNAKHTPGPWALINDAKTEPQWVKGSNGSSAALAFGKTEEMAAANARLIAAAPELLEALKTFVAEYVELVDSGDAGFWNAEEEAKVIAARDAIAKAEGREG